MDFSHFPMDRQNCPVQIGSSNFDDSHIIFTCKFSRLLKKKPSNNYRIEVRGHAYCGAGQESVPSQGNARQIVVRGAHPTTAHPARADSRGATSIRESVAARTYIMSACVVR